MATCGILEDAVSNNCFKTAEELAEELEAVKGKLRGHIEAILKLVGDDPKREGLLDTPDRVARMYLDICKGLRTVPPVVTTFKTDTSDMVIVRDIPFYSMCEHHLVTFFGTADIGYIPDKCICGLSKFSRVLDYWAARPQIQERLTNQVLHYLVDALKPSGMIVRLKARHLCMESRGIRKSGSDTVTAAIYGAFKELSVRNEFYANLNRG